MSGFSRRQLLTTTALAVAVAPTVSLGAVIKGGLPWTSDPSGPPRPVTTGPWQYFTGREGADVEALVDRLIPADPQTPGGKDLGCAVFIDRQLAGGYGTFRGLYMSGPFQPGTATQGAQSPLTPAKHYRQALAALDGHCRSAFSGSAFAALADERKDEVIGGLENGSLKLANVDGPKFFELLLTDTRQGFFADPIYGGNKDMASWKMIGFPGARYDYRDWVDRHNERYPLPPVGIELHPAWGA